MLAYDGRLPEPPYRTTDDDQFATITALQAENARLRNALRFYASIVPSKDVISDTEPSCGPLDGLPFGSKARAALAESEVTP